ncbi:chorismate synthase [Synchytrium endobioticum]|uniref:Chorismate synthase n=1 Tax=Synchytrium endobioticum TaxID=286115 RepID=A0A507DG14_9FUNG|nr:chorismate synthase [Synchytrium endobioticum]TPX50543.1 chorismate synthase [Synchytrium endobioticum]
MSTFGHVFRVTTFGESHCKAVGVIIDGCPPGLALSEQDIQPQLDRRRPGQSNLTTPRNEKDRVTILSGTEKGFTLGTPISMSVPNEDQRPHDYGEMDLYPRPSHADTTYLDKYGIKASSGGGRSSARETIGRVAAAAIAEKYLKLATGLQVVAFVSSVGHVDMSPDFQNKANSALVLPGFTNGTDTPVSGNTPSKVPKADQPPALTEKEQAYLKKWQEWWKKLATITREDVDANEVRCPDGDTYERMKERIIQARDAYDSIGGTVTCVIRNVPKGLGEPCFDKLEALLAHAMLSIPAIKGFEIGSGFVGTNIPGHLHNDPFMKREDGSLGTLTNFSGGVQGGISNGENIYFKVAFKPPATIALPQSTATYDGVSGTLAAKGRHDPCVLPRAVPIVEAMASLTIMDAFLLQQSRVAATSKIPRVITDTIPAVLKGELGNAGGKRKECD